MNVLVKAIQRCKKKKLNTWRSRDQISSKVHIYWSDERSGSQSLMFGGGHSGVGLFGRKVRVAVGRHHHGDQALRGRCVDGVGHLGDGGEALLHAAGRQSRLCVVVPALLDGLAQLAQTLTEPQRKRSKLGQDHLKDSKIWIFTFKNERCHKQSRCTCMHRAAQYSIWSQAHFDTHFYKCAHIKKVAI